MSLNCSLSPFFPFCPTFYSLSLFIDFLIPTDCLMKITSMVNYHHHWEILCIRKICLCVSFSPPSFLLLFSFFSPFFFFLFFQRPTFSSFQNPSFPISFPLHLLLFSQRWLDANHLKGTLPESLGKMYSLKSFWISSNSMEGTIPTSIGRLVELDTLFSSFFFFIVVVNVIVLIVVLLLLCKVRCWFIFLSFCHSLYSSFFFQVPLMTIISLGQFLQS